MVMFKAKFRPMAPQPSRRTEKPRAANGLRLQQQQQQQPQPQPQPQPEVPPIEDERGPQAPVREPGPRPVPERAVS